MSATEYMDSSSYELFIRRAYDSPSQMKNGAHQCFMQNAMTMEAGKTFAKHLGTFEKQFEEVKVYMAKALEKYKTKKEFSNLLSFFDEQSNRLENAVTTAQLIGIVKATIDKLPPRV